MKLFGAKITPTVSSYLYGKIRSIDSIEIANKILLDSFGIKDFFDNKSELAHLREAISEIYHILEEPERAEYGDFQTNETLADRVSAELKSKNFSPDVIVEPTCGKGGFVISALKKFPDTKYIYGIEIYKPYVWETKFSIIDFYLDNNTNKKPEIIIKHADVFCFDFKQIANKHIQDKVLIIGNPPWVTNSKLGGLSSTNLPNKTNFKKHSGLDSITGKGNFDIAEYITLMILNSFQHIDGYLMFLIKNSVIKNIIFDQPKNRYKIGSIKKYIIDSKKEFSVSVEASLLFCKLNSTPENFCLEFDIYFDNPPKRKFGWVDDKFVSNIDTYIFTKDIDGKSPFIWRQGLKHDCSAIMELDRINGTYKNGIDEDIELEETLIYGILKSSDLKNTVINHIRKYTIVTQKKVGQDTLGIKIAYPKTYQYLINHKSFFDARKSIIYSNKPLFSIFGIGDYSFKPYKVAISGLYKTFHFTLVLPQAGKPVMLDDTCYLIGFDKLESAIYSLILLNSEKTVKLLEAITFSDAKRTFTKDILMRIDIRKLAESVSTLYLKKEIAKLNEKYNFSLTLNCWEEFLAEMSPNNFSQTEMFA